MRCMLEGCHAHVAGKLRHEAVYRAPGAPFAEGARRLTRFVAHDLAVVGLDDTLGIAGQSQGSAVDPYGVVVGGTQRDWAVRNLGIKPGGIEDAVRRQRVIESLATNPLGIGVCPSPLADCACDGVRILMASHRGELRLEAPEDRVDVAVAEAVADESSIGIDDVICCQLSGRCSEGDDPVSLERNGIGDGEVRLPGDLDSRPDNGVFDARDAHEAPSRVVSKQANVV